MADFDATLYFLDDREIEYLQARDRARVRAGSAREHRRACCSTSSRRRPTPTVRAEVLDDLQTLMVYLLAAGHFRGVARSAARIAGAVSARPRAHAGAARAARRSSPIASARRTRCRNCFSRSTTSPSFRRTRGARRSCSISCGRRRWRRCSSGWQASQNDAAARRCSSSAAERLAAANTAELVRLIQSPDPEVSPEAIRRAGALKAQAAVLPLGKVLGEPDVGAAPARRAGADRDRIAGRAAGARARDRGRRPRRAHRRRARVDVAEPIGRRSRASRRSVKGKAVRDADLTEKMAFFEAYGALCGDGGVAQLDAMLNGKGFLGRREDPEIRACAAIALGRVGTAKRDRSAAQSGRRKGRRRAQRRDARAARRRRACDVVEQPRHDGPARGARRVQRVERRVGDAYIRRAGRQLIFALYGALRAVKLYPLENAAVQKALAELTTSEQGADRAARASSSCACRASSSSSTRRAFGSTSTTSRASATSCRSFARAGVGTRHRRGGRRREGLARSSCRCCRRPALDDPARAVRRS